MSDDAAEPLISVALCTYNGTRYLREQLDSLLAQSYRNIEIVAVDDCSADDTVAVLKEYAQRDSRLRVTANPTNIGVKRNFERAMGLCRGIFIAPCDQDDIWLPEKLSALFAVIGSQPLAYCDSAVIDAEGNTLSKSLSDIFAMRSTDDLVLFAASNCVSGHAMLFRRELIALAFPVPESFFHDWWLAAVATTCGGIVYCDRRLVKYRQHGGNITNILGGLTQEKAKRSPGYRWNNLREFGVRLQCLAALPGKYQPFVQNLSCLWNAREQQWFSPALAIFMCRHGRRLYSLQKNSRFSWRRAVKFAWGLRLKRAVNRYAYTST